MKALDGHTPHEILYCVKLDLADLCAFGTLCAIVEPSEIEENNKCWCVGQALVGCMCLESSGGQPSLPIEGKVFEF